MRLFHSIFGDHEAAPGAFPERLIDEAIERAVDGTDPRIRLLPGYRRSLRKPVIHAIAHVTPLVDLLPPPVLAGRRTFADEPALAALYASAADMLENFSRDHSLSEYLAGPEGRGVEQITALLLAERKHRATFGIELEGELLRRDVPQVTVCFSHHNLVDHRATEAESRLQLKRRAFDHLLFLALARISEVRVVRADLLAQRELLRGKLAALRRGGWQLDANADERQDLHTLETELYAIQHQLIYLGGDDQVLQSHLQILIDVLQTAERQLWVDEVTLSVDAMNIQRDPQDPRGRRVHLQELCNAREDRLTMLLVTFDRRDLPHHEDLVTAAGRYRY